MRVCPRCRSIYSAQIERCPSDGERVADEHTYPLIGETLDRYRIVAPIGEGAMGVVYRATHLVLPRDYAIKVLFKDLSMNQTLIERFRREAQAVSTIAHPNIVSVADFVTLDDGLTFIVMELLSGRTLDRAIAAEAPFSPLRVARISAQIAAGLGEAHRMGFVHRDVKPSNVMLTEAQGKELVKVLDFGVVGLGQAPIGTRLTAIGHIIGTPTYMAPEQVHDPSVGPAADLYALGVLMFEMLAGEPPFQGPDRATVFVKHISEQPPALPKSEGLELLVAWLLEKRPERRPKNADEVINAIDRLGIVPDGEVLIVPPKRSESRLAAIAAADLRSGRPVIARSGRDPSIFENDTYEVDTDSAIPREAIRRALGSDDPTPDRLRPTRSQAKRIVTRRPETGSEPTFRASRAILEKPRRAPAEPEELFPALMPAHNGADWSSWNPDGFYEPVHPDPAEVERRDATLPIDVLESGTTDPRGTAAPSAGPAHESSPEPIGIAKAKGGEDPNSTQIVRERERRADEREDSIERASGPVEVTDLMLFEPELPPPTVERGSDPADDGPTQVDFNALDAFGITDVPALSPPIGDALPATSASASAKDAAGRSDEPRAGSSAGGEGASPSRSFPFAKTMLTPAVMKQNGLGASVPDPELAAPLDVENAVEPNPNGVGPALIPSDFSTQVDFIDRSMILADEAHSTGVDRRSPEAPGPAPPAGGAEPASSAKRPEGRDATPVLEAPDVPRSAIATEDDGPLPVLAGAAIGGSQVETTLLNDMSHYYRETMRDSALQSGRAALEPDEGPPLRDPAREERRPIEPRIIVMIALLIGCVILAAIAFMID